MITAPRALRGLGALGCAALLVACRSRGADVGHDAAASEDATRPATDARSAETWAELAELPRARAARVIALPTRADVPRFEVHGPVLADDVAALASSQFGFLGVDVRAGEVRWSKAAGLHVAPPVALASGDLALIGDCATPPTTERPVLGCLRVVTSAGVERAYGAIYGERAVAERMAGPGAQRAWELSEGRVAWRRGDAVVAVDLATGEATATDAAPAPLLVRYRTRSLEVTLEDGELRARARERGASGWRAPGRFAALLGIVPGLPYEAPMLRVVRASTARRAPPAPTAYFDLLDLDAMTAAGGQAATPAPGLLLLGTAAGDEAAAALAVRLDTSLRRDYVVTYTSGARLAWVYPLPLQLRTDPVGLAVTRDAVLAFHDGDTLTVLPRIE